MRQISRPIRNHESLLENQTRSTPVECPFDSENQQLETPRNWNDMTANDSGDDNISFPKVLTSQIEERLVRDDFTNEFYMTLSSKIVLKRKKEMLHVPLDFKNGLTVDAFVDSGAYVSAKVQKHLDIIKQPAPANVFKINNPPNFQIQVGNGQLKNQ